MPQFIAKRVISTIVTLLAVAVTSFILIQLPPGDFLTSYIAQLESTGTVLDESEVVSLQQRYGLNDPIYVQFAKWFGNVLQGDFGVSFQYNRPVNELIWDRLGYTFLISFSTLMFTWIVALPIGIYSATHQYSFGDYFATLIGFIGRGIPDFMLALILMWIGLTVFGVSAGGLFSLEYRNAPWSWGKVLDLLSHLWVPIIILGTSNTAGLIRIMRNNLLDELHKPYVETARSKGLSEYRLLWKYPVRLALNPFVSTVGWSLPTLISGDTIVAVVLGLPTTGPLLLSALLSQDMYLAGSFVLILSAFTVIGTFVSDILLAVLDPRIRFD
ncbi:MAG: ABC transporter permease [Anaerolineaceae bacterium]|nr:ABC transporter permease [Anaerolineaceae bacterium]